MQAELTIEAAEVAIAEAARGSVAGLESIPAAFILDHAASLLPSLVSLCDSESSAAVNAAWKQIVALAVARPTSIPFATFASLIVRKLHSSVGAETFATVKGRRVARFVVAHCLTVVRECTADASRTMGKELVGVYLKAAQLVSLGTDEKQELTMQILPRLEAALSGLIACEEVELDHKMELLAFCANGGNCSDSEKTPSLSQSVFVGFCAMLREAQRLRADSDFVTTILKAMLLWLPGMDAVLECTADTTPPLLRAVASMARVAPPHMLVDTLPYDALKANVGEVRLFHRWWFSMARVLCACTRLS